MARKMNQRIGMKAMKMKQSGNPKAGMNGKEITMMSTDLQGKGKRGNKEKGQGGGSFLRKGKGKGKKGHGPQQGSDKQWEKAHCILLNPRRSRKLYLRHPMPPVSLRHSLQCN